MAKKSLTSKKKGPKGKKARAAAKLDKRWGEVVNDEDVAKAKIRKGKSRLIGGPSRIKHSSNKNNGIMTNNNHDKDGGYHYNNNNSNNFQNKNDDDDDDDDLNDSEMENDSDNHDDDDQDPLMSLLKNINYSGKNETKQRSSSFSDDSYIVSNDDDDDEDGQSTPSDYSDDDISHNQDFSDNDDEQQKVGNLVDCIQPYGKNPHQSHFHDHFDEKDTPSSSSSSLHPQQPTQIKVNTNHYLNSNIILQLSSNPTNNPKHYNNNIFHSNNITKNDNNNMLNFETIHQLALESFSHNSKQVLTHWKQFNRNAMKQNADSSSSSSSLLSLSNGEGGGGKLIDTNDILSKLQSAIYPSLANYQDIFISMYSNNNREAVDNLLCLHVVNHILASNQIIQLNNKRIQDQEGENNEDSDDNDESREEWRDQGYTRPKVLVLLPTRGMAASFIEQMIQLLGDDDNNNTFYENLERFQEEYGTVKPDPDLNSNQVMESVDEANRRRKAVLNAKGKDWLELFGDESNSDDDFKIGISFSSSKPNNKQQRNGKKNSNSKKKGLCVKFFSEFYHCDLILASPLGLKMSQDGEEEESDFDFLSSVEVVLVHHSDVIYMQNWDHMNFLLDNINQQPKKSSGIDFSRVRKYLLDGEAANRRQLIFVSRFNDPHIQAAFNRKGTSIAGKLKVRKRYPDDQASICNVLTNVRQIFQRVPCDSFLTQGDCRLKYFREHILPQIIRTKQSHTLIFIPSYFEFVSLRNLLLKLEISFVSVTEYARGSEVSRGRARFLQGRKPIMLYTGRAHFFLRHHIKGAKHLIMFGLPEYADFYPGLLNMLADQPNLNDDALDSPMSSLGLFTSYDALSLERIVGSKRCERMLSGEKNMFLFKS